MIDVIPQESSLGDEELTKTRTFPAAASKDAKDDQEDGRGNIRCMVNIEFSGLSIKFFSKTG